MERGAPFSRILLPKSNSGVNLEQQSNPNPMTSSGAASRAGPEVQQQPGTVRVQDLYMPMTNVNRIIRTILPPHAKVSDDAKETIQECITEFISFVTGEANERCQLEQRNTITADDILWAMTKLRLRSEPSSLRQSYGANGVVFHGPQYGLPPPGPYGYGVCDQYMGIGPIRGGGPYYPNWSGQDGTGASGGDNFSSSVNGVPENDPYGQYK